MKSGRPYLLPDSHFIYILCGKISPSQSFIKRFNCRLRECICWGCSGGGRAWSPSSSGDLRWHRYCCRLQNLTSGCHCQGVAPVQHLLEEQRGSPPSPISTIWIGAVAPRGWGTPRHAVLSSRWQLFLPSSPCEHLHSARLPPPQIHRINGPRPPTHQPPTPADEFNTKSEAASLIDWSLL